MILGVLCVCVRESAIQISVYRLANAVVRSSWILTKQFGLRLSRITPLTALSMFCLEVKFCFMQLHIFS